MLDEDLAEIRIGIYATPADTARLAEECSAVLRGSAVPHEISVASQEQAPEGEEMPIAEFYDELPQQWRIENPGADPESRRIREIRIGLVTNRPKLNALREELTRIVCPDPEHASPCPVPWTSSCSGNDESGLGHRYASLLPG